VHRAAGFFRGWRRDAPLAVESVPDAQRKLDLAD